MTKASGGVHDGIVRDLEARLKERGTYLGLRSLMPYSRGEFDVLGVKKTDDHQYFFHYYEVKTRLTRSQRRTAMVQAKRFYEHFGTSHQFILTDGKEFVRIRPKEVMNGEYK